jgi:charged multivesicular body protein 2A
LAFDVGFDSKIFNTRSSHRDTKRRENKRLLDKSVRELDRERSSLINQEKKLFAEIKRLAGQNLLGAVKVMAKDLVRTRRSITKFYGLKSQLQAVSLRMQTLKTTKAMADAMCGVTRAMRSMHRQLNVPSLNNIMLEFERHNEIMENATDVLGDVVDDAVVADGDEEESEELVGQVLDE